MQVSQTFSLHTLFKDLSKYFENLKLSIYTKSTLFNTFNK